MHAVSPHFVTTMPEGACTMPFGSRLLKTWRNNGEALTGELPMTGGMSLYSAAPADTVCAMNSLCGSNGANRLAAATWITTGTL